MGVKVRCPLLCVHVSFVLVYMDLKSFDTETFLADRSELLEFLHGGFLLDYYYPLSYGCGFSLHLLPNRIEISLFRTLQPMGDAISTQLSFKWLSSDEHSPTLFPKVVNLAPRLHCLYMNTCCSHKLTFL